jgi:hypothetical protein
MGNQVATQRYELDLADIDEVSLVTDTHRHKTPKRFRKVRAKAKSKPNMCLATDKVKAERKAAASKLFKRRQEKEHNSKRRHGHARQARVELKFMAGTVSLGIPADDLDTLFA